MTRKMSGGWLRAAMLSGFGLSALALGGCGAAPEAGNDSSNTEPSESELGSVEQAYGEFACVNYTDYDCGELGEYDSCVAVSPNENYGHPPACPDTWVAKARFNVGQGVLGIYRGVTPDGNTFPCNSSWVRMTIWRRPFGTQLYKVVVKDKLVQGYVNSRGSCSMPPVTAPLLEPGDYKIGARAGFLIYDAPVQITVL